MYFYLYFFYVLAIVDITPEAKIVAAALQYMKYLTTIVMALVEVVFEAMSAVSALLYVEVFDEVMREEGGWAQNLAKLDVTAKLRGAQGRLLQRELSDAWNKGCCDATGGCPYNGAVKLAARHLGGMFAWNLTNSAEVC